MPWRIADGLLVSCVRYPCIDFNVTYMEFNEAIDTCLIIFEDKKSERVLKNPFVFNKSLFGSQGASRSLVQSRPSWR